MNSRIVTSEKISAGEVKDVTNGDDWKFIKVVVEISLITVKL